MKRYHAVLHAKDADVFGILIGTLGVGMSPSPYILYRSLNVPQASYLPLISHLRALLKKAHKKAYTVSVGKLNPAKLANFAEIECFVLVACPENSVVESKVCYTVDDISILAHHPVGILSADRYSI
jgi:diphthamide biosynthesis protein 2